MSERMDDLARQSWLVDRMVDELDNQHEKWGQQNHPDGTGSNIPWDIPRGISTGDLRDRIRRGVDSLAKAGHSQWSGILLEEVFEALSESDPEALQDELVQVAAVAIQWATAIERRLGPRL